MEEKRAYSRDEVVDIIQSVLDNIGRDTDQRRKLHAELLMLSNYIQNMRAELARTQSAPLPNAADELDAVLHETAIAASSILAACESIEKTAATLAPETCDSLVQSVTGIYEACSFQDITGQRVTKVIHTLKEIEKIVSGILIFEKEATSTDIPSLLNGPQLGGKAMQQEDIDKLLDSF